MKLYLYIAIVSVRHLQTDRCKAHGTYGTCPKKVPKTVHFALHGVSVFPETVQNGPFRLRCTVLAFSGNGAKRSVPFRFAVRSVLKFLPSHYTATWSKAVTVIFQSKARAAIS